jgi:hypothetical protein
MNRFTVAVSFVADNERRPAIDLAGPKFG